MTTDISYHIMDPNLKQCLRRVALGKAGDSGANSYHRLQTRGLITKRWITRGNIARAYWLLTKDGERACRVSGIPIAVGTVEQKPQPELMTDLELHVATCLCQHGRITRDMPSTAEVQRALPLARSIITKVREVPSA